MMKKILIIISVFFGIIFLDSIQALIFDNSPIIGIKIGNEKKVGILVETHYCWYGKRDTVIEGFNYSCEYEKEKYVLVNEQGSSLCFQMLAAFYEDDIYTYYWSCANDNNMIVKYNDGSKELISEALKNKHIDIQALDKFNISYIKEKK